MVFDLKSMLQMYGMTPEQLKLLQAVTSGIRGTVSTGPGEVVVRLETSDPAAARFLPQITEQLVSSITQVLYQIYGITGERV